MADINQKHGKHVKSRPSDKDLTEADIIPASVVELVINLTN